MNMFSPPSSWCDYATVDMFQIKVSHSKFIDILVITLFIIMNNSKLVMMYTNVPFGT